MNRAVRPRGLPSRTVNLDALASTRDDADQPRLPISDAQRALLRDRLVKHHGLARRDPLPLGFLMRPQLNSGTLGARGAIECWNLQEFALNWRLFTNSMKANQSCRCRSRTLGASH